MPRNESRRKPSKICAHSLLASFVLKIWQVSNHYFPQDSNRYHVRPLPLPLQTRCARRPTPYGRNISPRKDRSMCICDFHSCRLAVPGGDPYSCGAFASGKWRVGVFSASYARTSSSWPCAAGRRPPVTQLQDGRGCCLRLPIDPDTPSASVVQLDLGNGRPHYL